MLPQSWKFILSASGICFAWLLVFGHQKCCAVFVHNTTKLYSIERKIILSRFVERLQTKVFSQNLKVLLRNLDLGSDMMMIWTLESNTGLNEMFSNCRVTGSSNLVFSKHVLSVTATWVRLTSEKKTSGDKLQQSASHRPSFFWKSPICQFQ